MARLLLEADLEGLVDLRECVGRIEAGYRADALGGVVHFPRLRHDARGATLAWLGAAIPSEDRMGYRSYAYLPDGSDRGDQVVAVYRHSTTELVGLILGNRLGRLRTGAAVAAAVHLAEPRLTRLGLVGTGAQARSALECLAAILPLEWVGVWSPNAEHRTAFRSWAERAVGVPVEFATGVGALARASPAIVLATSSEEPVVTSRMLESPTLLVSLSGYRRPEIDPEILDAADVLWTDSVEQAGAQGTLLHDAARRSKLRPLAAGLPEGTLARRDRNRVVLNTGAAWEELVVADQLLRRAEEDGRGVSIGAPAR
jgi:ornithine cyclodeaminase/alanine dehydrogenase-like protein (mu-crystallin family)